MTIKGTITPLRDKIFVTDMNFGDDVTPGGLIVLSDDGKGQGIKPRWARDWAIGPEQDDVKVGEWILIEHGRWTRAIKYETPDENVIELFVVENCSVLMSADERPRDVVRGIAAAAGGNFKFNVPGA